MYCKPQYPLFKERCSISEPISRKKSGAQSGLQSLLCPKTNLQQKCKERCSICISTSPLSLDQCIEPLTHFPLDIFPCNLAYNLPLIVLPSNIKCHWCCCCWKIEKIQHPPTLPQRALLRFLGFTMFVALTRTEPVFTRSILQCPTLPKRWFKSEFIYSKLIIVDVS